MKLDFWNRLAIAGACLAMVVYPYLGAQESKQRAALVAVRSYTACIQVGKARLNAKPEAVDAACLEQLDRDLEGIKADWTPYLSSLVLTFAACLAIFLAIWGAAHVVRWVGRGR